MNLWKKQLNYINIGAAGNKKFEPGLLSESNIIGLLCGRSGKSSFSGAPALCRERLRNAGSDRNRYTLDSHNRRHERAENSHLLAGSTKRMHFCCPRASWYFHKRANYLCSLLPRAAEQRSERRRSCTFQRAAISLGKVATPARSLSRTRPRLAFFAFSHVHAAHRPCERGSAPCMCTRINKQSSLPFTLSRHGRYSQPQRSAASFLALSACAPCRDLWRRTSSKKIGDKGKVRRKDGNSCEMEKIPFVEISDAVWGLNGKERFLRGKAPGMEM